jgi:hypothetical protein
VFLNLLLNARDAMPDGGRITVTIALVDDVVRIVFADTGAGIDPEIRGMVFDPFFSTKGPKHGTGLGLSITYSIVRDHGGTIQIDSVEGAAGTRFIIELPLLPNAVPVPEEDAG